jgi:hypothetical protein
MFVLATTGCHTRTTLSMAASQQEFRRRTDWEGAIERETHCQKKKNEKTSQWEQTRDELLWHCHRYLRVPTHTNPNVAALVPHVTYPHRQEHRLGLVHPRRERVVQIQEEDVVQDQWHAYGHDEQPKDVPSTSMTLAQDLNELVATKTPVSADELVQLHNENT